LGEGKGTGKKTRKAVSGTRIFLLLESNAQRWGGGEGGGCGVETKGEGKERVKKKDYR